MKPVNFLKDEKENKKKLILDNINNTAVKIIPILVLATIMIIDFAKINTNINDLSKDLASNEIIIDQLEEQVSSTDQVYISQADIDNFSDFKSLKLEEEDKVISTLQELKDKSNENIFITDLSYFTGTLKIHGNSSDEESINLWLGDELGLSLEEINFLGDYYTFILTGDYSEN